MAFDVKNQLLKQIIVHSTPWLKSHTEEEELKSKVIRIFLCQFTNTAILILVTKSAIGPFIDIPGEHYESMNAKWYAHNAAPMMMTMIIQLVTPSAMHLMMWPIMGAIKCSKRGSALTQNQLNAICAPKPRDFAAGYGEILLSMSVTLIYGALCCWQLHMYVCPRFQWEFAHKMRQMAKCCENRQWSVLM
jgi:hypothetical protein